LGPTEEEQLRKLTSYVVGLKKLGIGLCGLAETRIPGHGERKVQRGWKLLWSGPPESGKRQHGVGLLLSFNWSRHLIDYSPISDRLLVARFRLDGGINASMIVAYAPTEEAKESTKDAFYLRLYSTLAALPSRDLLVLMGDFNGQLGNSTKAGGVLGPHARGPKDVATDNGDRLLQLAGAFSLRLANTFFPHKQYHTATHKLPITVNRGLDACLRVIDYFAVSKRFMSSVTDCRVFRSFDAESDHILLTLTIRLRLSTARQQPRSGKAAAQGRYNIAKLQACPAARQTFEFELQNRFLPLAGPPSSEEEWAAFKEAAQVAATVALGDLQRQKEHTLRLSDSTLQLIDRKHQAHVACLKNPSVANKLAYRRLNNAAKKAVKRNQEAYYRRQAIYAEKALKKGNLTAFHRHVRRVFGDREGGSTSSASQGILGGSDGTKLLQGREAVIGRFAEHFAQVLNCPACLDPHMEQTLEGLVQQVEQGVGTYAPAQGAEAGEAPTLKEVSEAVFALRNGAAPGEDGIAAPMLKLSGTMLQWLHRVVVAVWESGHAPVEWKRALLVALYKGKGDRKVTDNYRGISLLSIPGKVYALIILSRVSSHIDSQLLDCQSAFRKGRGLTDALFTVRMLISRCVEFGQPLFTAFVDLRKAYDCVPREALWKVLRVYGVHEKLVQLLEDLHIGTQAAVKLGGAVSEWFEVKSGVRQGCVIAPLLFNIYMDFVVRQALAQMPPDCGVKLAYHADGQLLRSDGHGVGDLRLVSLLLYADDMVLLSQDAKELESMLQTMDKVCLGMGMRINASKTEIMAFVKQQQQEQQGTEVVIGEGVVKQVPKFKYLGSMLEQAGGWELELSTRKGKALARFEQFAKLWGTKHLSVSTKVRVYRAYVLPILLFGCETWALKAAQLQELERVHSYCLRRILGVRLSDRHSNVYIRERCGITALASILSSYRLRWLGHVGRMEPGRLPHIALFSSLHGVTKRPVGAPPKRWEKCVCDDLAGLHIPCDQWLDECSIRSAWRRKLWQMVNPQQAQRSRVRVSGRPSVAEAQAEAHMVPFWDPGANEDDTPLPYMRIRRQIPLPGYSL
jgi:endonuclease/exonuclease/phosphatase family metal-dependent hydrolase